MATARQWLAGRAANLLIIVLLATSLTMTAVNQVQIRRQSDCLARWADAYTARVNRITEANNAHNEASDKLTAATNTVLLDAINADRAGLKRDIPKYRAAVKDYQDAAAVLAKAQKANPVPDSPRLHC